MPQPPISNLTFADKGLALSDFVHHFTVHCPKCAGKADIDASNRLRCSQCFHTEDAGHWYGHAEALVQVKCRECRADILERQTWNGTWGKIDTICPKCGDKCQYDTNIIKLDRHNGLVTDPIFGLPLWYQCEVRNELFWAFNVAHLQYIQQYVAAKLRERGITPRNTIRKNSSLLSRLPVFIKTAKHRADLEKAISKLLAKQ